MSSSIGSAARKRFDWRRAKKTPAQESRTSAIQLEGVGHARSVNGRSGSVNRHPSATQSRCPRIDHASATAGAQPSATFAIAATTVQRVAAPSTASSASADAIAPFTS